jgi:hypothetical protein
VEDGDDEPTPPTPGPEELDTEVSVATPAVGGGVKVGVPATRLCDDSW